MPEPLDVVMMFEGSCFYAGGLRALVVNSPWWLRVPQPPSGVVSSSASATLGRRSLWCHIELVEVQSK